MTTTLLALAASCAVVAAIRSTWSPCGLSMLSTITPLAERTRGRRWGVTAAWFVVGAIVGGACLGALGAMVALVMRPVGISPAGALAGAIVASVMAAAMDFGVLGPELPHHRRQVDEQWLDQYRGWVYGFAFGVQIGTGPATYIMTAGVYLTVVLAGLTRDPLTALGVGVLFGLTRGLAIVSGIRLTTPDRVRAFHLRFESRRGVVRTATIAFELILAAVAAVAIGGPVGGVIVGLSLSVVVFVALVRRRRAVDVAELQGRALPADSAGSLSSRMSTTAESSTR
jgi:MFS family permease